MTKNIIDSAISFSNETSNAIGLIPSRRQIEYSGGYVNNWTTKEFVQYVTQRTSNIIVQRDHSGPGQGAIQDSGWLSLVDDCEYFDVIHIDPWKQYSNYSDGFQWTVNMIKVCDAVNPKLRYEIATEESIRKFEVRELERLLLDLKRELNHNLFNKIEYLVVQSGTSLKGNKQTGQYDQDRLVGMVQLAKKYNLLSKEHNGDYIPVAIIKEKFSLGLDAINIAPEFGLIETQTYLDQMEEGSDIFNKFWQICYESNKWVKWVDSNFDPTKNKLDLIKICGHYVISTPEFLTIKNSYQSIDDITKQKIKAKLNELHQ